MLKEEGRKEFLHEFIGVDPPLGDGPWERVVESSNRGRATMSAADREIVNAMAGRQVGWVRCRGIEGQGVKHFWGKVELR